MQHDTTASLGFALTTQEIALFWGRVDLPDDLDDPRPCWLYREDAPGDRGRYGHVRVRVAGGHRVFVHRLSLALCGGVLTEDKPLATHACHTPRCTSRWHVRPGTHASNAADRDAADRRTPFLARGEASPSAKLTAREANAIRAARELDVPAKVLAQMFSCSLATVYAVLSGAAYPAASAPASSRTPTGASRPAASAASQGQDRPGSASGWTL